MDITNETDLEKVMETLAREAIGDATNEILEIFKRDFIRKIVYNSHGPNVSYHAGSGKATYEFEKAWEWTEIKKNLNSLMTEMWYNPENMGFDADTFFHGSKYSNPNNVKENLMDILNKQGYSSSLWISVSRPEAYFDAFIKEMFDNGKLDQILSRHFIQKGFVKQ